MLIQVGKYERITPKSKSFLGERAQKNGLLAGDMRCLICGDWFSWSKQNILKYILARRWDAKRGEPAHCGSEHCDYYHRRYLKHLQRMADDPVYFQEMSYKIWKRKEQAKEHEAWNLFGRLKQNGAVN